MCHKIQRLLFGSYVVMLTFIPMIIFKEFYMLTVYCVVLVVASGTEENVVVKWCT